MNVVEWCNTMLKEANTEPVEDLNGFRDGVKLAALIEFVSDIKVKGVHKQPTVLVQMHENIELCLKALSADGLKQADHVCATDFNDARTGLAMGSEKMVEGLLHGIRVKYDKPVHKLPEVEEEKHELQADEIFDQIDGGSTAKSEDGSLSQREIFEWIKAHHGSLLDEYFGGDDTSTTKKKKKIAAFCHDIALLGDTQLKNDDGSYNVSKADFRVAYKGIQQTPHERVTA